MEIFALIIGVAGTAVVGWVGYGQVKERNRISFCIGIGLMIIALLLTFLTTLYAQEILEKSTVNCPNCDKTVSAEAAFCSDCGTALTNGTTTDPVCIGCGESIQPDANFCPNCGEPQNY